MTSPPKHRQPTHRSRRPRLPRWAAVVFALLVCVGGATSLIRNVTWVENNVTRGIDPSSADPEAPADPEGPEPILAAQSLPHLPKPARRVERVQSEIAPDLTVPADSGTGRRVVYSEGRQRVWLIGDGDGDGDGESVETTYLVSGSAYDNLSPGTFEVYSRSEQATSFDGGSTMAFFVRFTKGPTGAAIGFHDIPAERDGELVQSAEELGEPLSHGCIRQLRKDAIKLWDFAPIGTTVVVTP